MSIKQLWTKVRIWLKSRLDLYWRRYHLLDLRQPGVYEGGYLDPPEAIYMAVWRVLRDFVEQEMTSRGGAVGRGGVVDWDACVETTHIRDEILDLYEWWMRGRAVAHAALRERWRDTTARHGESVSFVPCKDSENYEMVRNQAKEWEVFRVDADRLEAEDDRRLDRLMVIRKYLWV